jgi:hypothetical protein
MRNIGDKVRTFKEEYTVVGGLYQITSKYNSIETAQVTSNAFNDIILAVKMNDGKGSRDALQTLFTFKSDVSGYSRGASNLANTRTILDSLDALRYEGCYCYLKKYWRRQYITREHVCIELYEEVPESGGQYCLWSAGIVMAKYLEYNKRARRDIRGKKLLELGL